MTDVAIVGGGLCGLALAARLGQAGVDYQLIESRDRFGGRILSLPSGDAQFDLGPAWFWPGQPRIAGMLNALGLKKFDQYIDGDFLFEDGQGRVQRGRGFSPMQGAHRLQGGLCTLIDALANRLPDDRKQLNWPVQKVRQGADGITLTAVKGDTINAQRVVFAMPPRVASMFHFSPSVDDDALQAVPTWMAGQAKAVAVYDAPFWRDAGLSGGVTSRFGPMIEIHDASPASGGPYALFGFIGVPPNARQDEQVLRQHVQAQLIRVFGEDAGKPKNLFIKDWAFDPHTSTPHDLAPLYAHPTYAQLPVLWNGTLLFSGTETAPQFGGYLEGALEAAELTAAQLA